MRDIGELNRHIVEFYEKLSSWEQGVVRGKGLTLPQAHTLEVLGDCGEMRMKELAEKMGVTTGTLTVLVDRMERRGLVLRKPHESDRRSILVALTDKGATLFAEHHDLHIRLTEELTSALADAEVATLSGLLESMNRRF